MAQKIVINPVTRISGFLEIQAVIEGNRIVDARSSGLLFRGFELMLRGRPPLDAIYFTERICGICSTAHATASSLALEGALGVVPDENSRLLRDIIHGCEFIQNHIRQFYQYTLPDFVRGPEIQPLYPVSHGDFRLPEGLERRLAESYILSMQYSRMAHQAIAVLGGKAPHNHGIFVGGVTVNADFSKLLEVKSLLRSIKQFVEARTIEDIGVISRYYSDYFSKGTGYGNLMSYGIFDYPDKSIYYVKPGIRLGAYELPIDTDKITQSVYRSWYQEKEALPDPTKTGAYSFIKAPRYEGYPMEVGPLARMLLSGEYRGGISAMDRIIARVLEIKKVLEVLEAMLERVKPQPAVQRKYAIPGRSQGQGLVDTARGALGHWLTIENAKIADYRVITPSAWNLSPMDQNGKRGVIEETLIGTEINNILEPVEIGRIVRSFDPCVSCATHVLTDGRAEQELTIIQ